MKILSFMPHQNVSLAFIAISMVTLTQSAAEPERRIIQGVASSELPMCPNHMGVELAKYKGTSERVCDLCNNRLVGAVYYGCHKVDTNCDYDVCQACYTKPLLLENLTHGAEDVDELRSRIADMELRLEQLKAELRNAEARGKTQKLQEHEKVVNYLKNDRSNGLYQSDTLNYSTVIVLDGVAMTKVDRHGQIGTQFEAEGIPFSLRHTDDMRRGMVSSRANSGEWLYCADKTSPDGGVYPPYRSFQLGKASEWGDRKTHLVHAFTPEDTIIPENAMVEVVREHCSSPRAGNR